MKTEEYHKQLLVLNIVLEELNNNERLYEASNVVYISQGLCATIVHAIHKVYDINILHRFIYEYIPLFNKRNAVKYGSSVNNYAYWWTIDIGRGAVDYRIAFVKWMIKEITFEYKHPILYWIKTNVFNKRVYHK